MYLLQHKWWRCLLHLDWGGRGGRGWTFCCQDELVWAHACLWLRTLAAMCPTPPSGELGRRQEEVGQAWRCPVRATPCPHWHLWPPMLGSHPEDKMVAFPQPRGGWAPPSSWGVGVERSQLRWLGHLPPAAPWGGGPEDLASVKYNVGFRTLPVIHLWRWKPDVDSAHNQTKSTSA